MPTGYTEFIENGKVRTAKQFLHLCLRAFGVCVRMREDPMEVEDDYTQKIIDGYQASIDYHQKLLDEAKENLKTYQEMSDDEMCVKYIQETSERIKDLQKNITREFGEYGDYLRLQEQIQNWDCDEEFSDIKDFALNQIKISIPDNSFYEEELAKCGKPTKEGYEERREEYRNSLIKHAQWDVEYHTNEIDRLLKSKADALAFYQRFKEELEKLK